MGIPTWTPGEVLASADVNSWFVPLSVVKPGDTTITSSTTLASDPDLVLAVAASASYSVDCYIDYEGGVQGSSDLKWEWTGPSGAGLSMTYFCIGTGGGGIVGNVIIALSSAQATGTNGGGTKMGLWMRGILNVSSTAGSFQFKWAQNTSSGTGTIVHADSHLMLRRVA
jgi:hypothetical protein